MSDQLAAAAAAMNVPEVLVQRSAEARAKASGGSAEDIIAAWAGGGSAPAPSAPEPSAAEPAAPEPAAAASDALAISRSVVTAFSTALAACP